jgi:hypothetical protein
LLNADDEHDKLAPRPWALRRINDWLDDGAPMLVVRGDPGSGKSSLLTHFLSTEPQTDVIGCVLRGASHREPDPFDSHALLSSIIARLSALGVESPDAATLGLPQALSISAEVQVGEVQTGAEVAAVVLNLATPMGLLPHAERLIRQVGTDQHALIVIDALDQAEDDGADDFLDIAAALLRAASGTGVRMLCSSRRRLPLGFDDRLAVAFDLVHDAPPATTDLQIYLKGRFAALSNGARDRIVSAIVQGAADNWLWATANATALEAEIREQGGVPDTIPLASGLEGLYKDGIRRIGNRIGARWESQARPLLAAVACSFNQRLSIPELRWITGLDATEIEDIAGLSAPFLRRTLDGVRAFHPDFARWIMAGNVEGASEESGHLAIAQGLTRFGHSAGWSALTPASAARVVDHWCAVLVLDPFSPDHRDHEQALSAILGDQDWTNVASVGIDVIEQAALVAPTLKLPGSHVPLSVGLRAVTSSPVTRLLAGCEVATRVPDPDAIKLLAQKQTPAQALNWLEAYVPDFSIIGMRLVWGGVLDGTFSVRRVDGDLEAFLTPEGFVRRLDAFELRNIGTLISLLDDVDAEYLERVITLSRELVDAADEGTSTWEIGLSMLGSARELLAAQNPEDDDVTRETLALFRQALAGSTATGAGRLALVINLANSLHALDDRTDEELDELVDAQKAILSARHELADEAWPTSAALLGDVYIQRARRREDPSLERAADIEQALDAYRTVIAATTHGAPERLSALIGIANALRLIERRSHRQVEEWIETQTELLQRLRDIGDDDWLSSVNLLGDAYVERAEQGDGQEQATDRRRAIRAYRTAVAFTPPDDPRRATFLIDLANALRSVEERSPDELDELIAVEAELVDHRRKNEEDDDWHRSAGLLSTAYRERAQSRTNDRAARAADLRLAAETCRMALDGLPSDGDERLAISAWLADALLLLDDRTSEELDELIGIQSAVVELSHGDAMGVDWTFAASLLGRSYQQRARTYAEDDPARAEDLQRALESSHAALEGIAEEADDERLTVLIDIANTLLAMNERARPQIDELVDLQTEIVARQREREPEHWPKALLLLGNAHWERVLTYSANDPARMKDIELALAAYRKARQAVSPEDRLRLVVALRLANTLATLEHTSDEHLDELVEVRTEILGLRRDHNDESWPVSANYLADAYAERATRHKEDDPLGDADLSAAVDLYRAALAGTSSEDAEHRLQFAIDFSNGLRLLRHRSPTLVMEQIAVQTEIVARLRQHEETNWPLAVNLLGDAYLERAEHLKDSGPGERVEALARALEAYGTALDATPPDSESWLTYAIDLANCLLELDRRSAAELGRLIDLQREITLRRRKLDDPDWLASARILGDAYFDRSGHQDNESERAADLARSLQAYRDALEGLPPGSTHQLAYAISLANALVVHAAVTRTGGPGTLQEAAQLVAGAMSDNSKDPGAMRTLFPVLRAALRRQRGISDEHSTSPVAPGL